ncbi:UBP12, partial [Symbiodinium pilosum]
VRSESKTVGNFRFRLLIFPCGTQTAGGQQVSAFVEADPLETLDPRWCFHGVKYQITLVNWTDYRRSVTKSDIWSFSRDGIDRGWHDMVRVSELIPETGWVGPDNTLLFRASCYVRSADQLNLTNDYSCKKETGFTGLKNHGATCYMNGLLQSLFHVGEFRRIVYSIEGDDVDAQEEREDAGKEEMEDVDSKPQLIQALQNVFYKMQTSDQAVNCKELMKSFGWDTMDAFTQHDAQELNRILCDRLEERMKNTPSDGSIKRLFEGEMENYIECIDVDYKSRRNETFYDIQLNIKSERGQELQNIVESFHDFTAEETLEGDNAYEAEGHGKQRAKKGIRFLRFPPVLNLQLKRFHFDLEKMDMVKLNSRFEFPRKLDLSPFAPDGGRYDLFAVVVHNGDVNSGHYYAHIQPDPERGWFKFDDEMVTPCSEYAAIEDNYGGGDLGVWNYFDRRPSELRSVSPNTKPRIHNAYMLMYIREDLSRQILTPPDPKVVNPKMVDRCDREVRLAEQRRREKVEQQTKIRIKLVTEANLCQMTGFWDHTQVPYKQMYKFGRDSPVKDFIEQLSQEAGIDQNHLAPFVLQYRTSPRQIRFGHMSLNSSFKSHIPPYGAPHFDVGDPSLLVLVIMSRGYSLHSLRWSREDAKPDDLSTWDEEKVTMLVVKYFCAQTKRLLSMVTDGWVAHKLQSHINSKQVAQPPADADVWACWEDMGTVVKLEQLFSGDAIIWQKMRADDEREVAAQSTDCIKDECLTVQMDTDSPPVYPILTVADLSAHQANSVDVTVLLHDSKQPLCVDGWLMGTGGPPEPEVTTREERPEDAALLLCPAKFSRAEEIEPLNAPSRDQATLKELQRNLSYLSSTSKRQLTLHAVELPFQPGGRVLEKGLCPLCIRFFDDAVREVGSEVIFVPNDGNISDVLSEAQGLLKPEWGISGPLRALEVSESRLHKLYRPDQPVRGLACFSRANIFYNSVRIEADRENLGTGQRLMEIFHCDRSSQQAFAMPLLMTVTNAEKSGSIKQRCKDKLQVPDPEFKSWRLVRCSRTGSNRIHLKDDEPWDGEASDPRLCLEHVHPNPMNALSRQSRHNKPLTIKA